MDWEYPGSRGSPAEDKARFTTLLQVSSKLSRFSRNEEILSTYPLFYFVNLRN